MAAAAAAASSNGKAEAPHSDSDLSTDSDADPPETGATEVVLKAFADSVDRNVEIVMVSLQHACDVQADNDRLSYVSYCLAESARCFVELQESPTFAKDMKDLFDRAVAEHESAPAALAALEARIQKAGGLATFSRDDPIRHKRTNLRDVIAEGKPAFPAEAFQLGKPLDGAPPAAKSICLLRSAPTASAIEAELSRRCDEDAKPHLVIFVGHGKRSGHFASQGKGADKVKGADGGELAKALRRVPWFEHTRGVVLFSCHGLVMAKLAREVCPTKEWFGHPEIAQFHFVEHGNHPMARFVSFLLTVLRRKRFADSVSLQLDGPKGKKYDWNVELGFRHVLRSVSYSCYCSHSDLFQVKKDDKGHKSYPVICSAGSGYQTRGEFLGQCVGAGPEDQWTE